MTDDIAATPSCARSAAMVVFQRVTCELAPRSNQRGERYAGCSIGDVNPTLTPLPPNPPDMQVVNSEAVRIFAVLKLPGSPELSRLRPAHPNTLAEWMFCLRSDADDLPRNYALFLRNNALLYFARSIEKLSNHTEPKIGH